VTIERPESMEVSSANAPFQPASSREPQHYVIGSQYHRLIVLDAWVPCQGRCRSKGLRVSHLDGRFTPTFARTVAKYQERIAAGLLLSSREQASFADAVAWSGKGIVRRSEVGSSTQPFHPRFYGLGPQERVVVLD
jgi:hypothetical protein